MKKKVLSVFFAFLILCTVLFPTPWGFVRESSAAAKTVTEAEVTEIVEKYYNTVSNYGKKKAYWNAGKSTAALKSLINSGEYLATVTYKSCVATSKSNHSCKVKVNGKKGCTSNIFQGVGSIKDGVFNAKGKDSQCSGFAAFMEYVIFGSTDPKDFTVYGGKKSLPANYRVKPGDQIRQGSHSFVVYEVVGNKVKTIECNISKKGSFCLIYTKDSRTVSSLKSYKYDGKKTFYISSPAVANPSFPVTSTLTFNANGGACSTASKRVTSGQTYGTLPTPSRTGYDFIGWYDASSGGNLITNSTKVTKTSNHTLYAHWTAGQYVLYFNANGGTCTTGSKKVTFNSTYGTLPTPTKSGYTFQGWYTAMSGGTKVTDSTKLTTAANQTVYAQWKPVPVSTLKYTYNPDLAISKASSLLTTAESKKHKCATYVSSVLRAGGLTNVKQSGAGDLIDYLNKSSNFGGSIGKVITNPTASQLHKGDVLCVVCTKGAKANYSNGHSKGSGKYYGLHVLIVSSVNESANTVRYYAANSYVYGNKDLKLSEYKVKCSKCGNNKSAKLIAFVFNDAVKGK